MTDARERAEAGIADAVAQLSNDTAALVRQEIEAARRELWERAQQSAPAVGLLGASAVLAVFATASAYRVGLRFLERIFPPTVAAILATTGYGVAAGYAASEGMRRLREAPPLFPVDTARETAQAVGEAASEVRERV
jgi:hypothetical protein